MSAEFVHLHAHTQYSFLRSTLKLTDLARRTSELGMPAVAMTDSANMFGAIRHLRYSADAGIQGILGCELNVLRDDTSQIADHMVLLAASNQGYRNLVRLVSSAQLESASDAVPAVNLEVLARHTEGLVGLTGCLGGIVPQMVLEQGQERASGLLGRLGDCFATGHLYLEIQKHGLPEQAVLNDALVRLGHRHDLPLVATNDVHFKNREDGQAQLYLECIRQGRSYAEASAQHHGSFEMYLKSPEEMRQTFDDLPEALSNTLRIAEMCSEMRLVLGKPMLPHFSVPSGYDTDTYFRHVAHQGLDARFEQRRSLGEAVDEPRYRERLQAELEVIVKMEFAGYFLIVWDFIREAKSRKVPVGPGRGSGAGSLTAYALGITELDPIPYTLLFERFLNPERVSMPDFDIDFCMDRRGEVIDYVSAKYGKNSVGQIATFQNLKARSVIKDVGRVMGLPAVDTQRIAALVPEKGQGKMCTIEEALQIEPKLRAAVQSDPTTATLIEQATKLEGLTRHAGMHAAGIVISDGPLFDHVPCFLSDQALVTQYDKEDVETAGLVKFDFLGLKTLTVIAIAERLVNARPDRKDRPLILAEAPLDDRETYQLIASGETTGVFQLESSGMQQMLRQLRPDCFEDIIAAVALYRPGPLGGGMVERFIRCKHGRDPVRKLHPLIDAALEPTYGVIVYQEQVMQIAQQLSGYTLGGADLLRRAMGKKKVEEMAKQKSHFTEGAVARGVSPEQASAIFDEVEKFAAYGFNKSHSAAYALVTYQTAYLKAHYPAEFFAATMTADKDKIEKVVRTIAESRAWGVRVLPPDVNASELDFTVVYDQPEPEGSSNKGKPLKDALRPGIRFGLGAVRGLGESALEGVFEARSAGGSFRDLFEFAARVDGRRLNRGILESLIQCGALDEPCSRLGVSRARAFASIDRALERARNSTRDRERGQTTLFGQLYPSGPNAEHDSSNLLGDYAVDVVDWDRMELLRREKSALGCYVTGHPLSRYANKLQRLDVTATSRLGQLDNWTAVNVAGMVENYEERMFRGGEGKAAFFQLEDLNGRVRAKVRQDRIESFVQQLQCGEPVLVRGKISFPPTEDEIEEREPTLLVDSVEPLGAAAQRVTRSVGVRLSAERAGRAQLESLRAIMLQHPGSCPLDVVVALADGAEAWLTVDSPRVCPDEAMLSSLERELGPDTVELH